MISRSLRIAALGLAPSLAVVPHANAQSNEARAFDIAVFASWGGSVRSDVLKVAHEGSAEQHNTVLGNAAVAAAGVELLGPRDTRLRFTAARSFGGSVDRSRLMLDCGACIPETRYDGIMPASVWAVSSDVAMGVFTSWPVYPHVGLGIGYRYVDYDQARMPEAYASDFARDDGEWFHQSVVGLTAPIGSRVRLWGEIYSRSSGIIGRFGSSRHLSSPRTGQYLFGATWIVR